jgi:ribonuclease HII
MAVLVGIDEAGFGPILGPLTVSLSAFSLPHDLLDADLWQVLQKSIANKRKRLAGRLLIADSKKAYSKAIGIKHLERAVLACLKCFGNRPVTLTELLTVLCPDMSGLNVYPWYKNIEKHRLAANQSDIAIAAKVFEDDLALHNMKLLKLQSHCLEVAHYNRMVNNVKNKANVLFSITASLIKQAYDNFGGDELQIIIDRQGGRVHYRSSLQRMFPGMELTILKETPANSSYELQLNGKKMRLHFAIGADDRFLPVSLASMVSKYLRELLIHNINCYFTGFYNDLRPTAGYWTDGLRFIADIKKNIPNIQIDMNQLVRCR